MTPIAGRLSDIFGKKKILLIVMAVYSTGILAGGFANSIGFMLAARAAQGIGMSMFPIAFGIIREILPEKKLAIGQTIFSSTFSGGAVVGLVVGATIIQNFGWQATFFSIFPIAVILGLVIRKILHVTKPATSKVRVEAGGGNDENSPIKTQTIDLKGTLALAVTIISFLAGISFLENNSTSIGFQVAGLFSVASSITCSVYRHRKESEFTFAGSQIDDSQNDPSCNHHFDVGLSMHVHGLPDNTYHGKKPSTARVRRRCGGYRECASSHS